MVRQTFSYPAVRPYNSGVYSCRLTTALDFIDLFWNSDEEWWEVLAEPETDAPEVVSGVAEWKFA